MGARVLLVVGGTGRLGARVGSRLARRGDVRGLSRSEGADRKLRELGIEDISRADLDRPETLSAALRGIRVVFLLTPFSKEQAEREIALAEAAACAGAERLVKISSEAIRAAEEVPPDTLLGGKPPAQTMIVASHAAVEQRISELPLQAVFLRPTFISHVLDGQRGAIAAGELRLPGGDAELSLVDPEDVAEAAVAAMLADEVPDSPVHLTGPEALSFHAMAERIGRAKDIEVGYRPNSRVEWRDELTAAGTPADLACGVSEALELFVRRGAAPVHDGVEELLGRSATPLDRYLREEL